LILQEPGDQRRLFHQRDFIRFFLLQTKDRRDFGGKDFSTMSMKARFQSQRRLKSLSKLSLAADKVNGIWRLTRQKKTAES
jgi:hypothetical protein